MMDLLLAFLQVKVFTEHAIRCSHLCDVHMDVCCDYDYNGDLSDMHTVQYCCWTLSKSCTGISLNILLGNTMLIIHI